MTNRDDLQAAGATVDQAIASITGMPVGTSHADAGAALGSSWDADVAAAKPPRPITVYGSSVGDSAAATKALVQPKRMRTYNQAMLSACKALGITEYHHSEKSNLAALAAQNAAEVKLVRDWFAAVPVGDVTIGHETDNDTPFSTTPGSANHNASKTYQAAWTVFLAIIADLNTSRDPAHQLRPVDVTTGVLYRKGVPEWWIVPTSPVHGIDVYDPHNYDLIYNKLSALGYTDWTIPETGWSADRTATPAPDATYLARIKADVAKWAAYPHPPQSVYWNNNYGSEFTQRPQTASYIASLCALG